VAQGFSGETNNLSFGPSAPAASQTGPAVLLTESTVGGAIPNCVAGTTVGDTHLYTFNGLFYDFQASGDFTLAQVEPEFLGEQKQVAGAANSVVQDRQVLPQFVVQARQVSGAPQWPNTAVNQGIATQMGPSRVAVCLSPSRLSVNGMDIQLGDGKVFSTPDGVDVSRAGQTYTITDQSGNSVQAVVHATWIDVTVGLGTWPEKVAGLLANADGNVNQIATRPVATGGGTVLTAPFAFAPFYQSYGDSWRVPPQESLLSPCGQVVEARNPQIPFYAINLDPALYNQTRAVCAAAGVKSAPLLDACTLDVAVIGSNQAAQVYVNARQSDAVGLVLLNPPPPVLQIARTSLPNGTVGIPYSQTLTATGGTLPYSWKVVGGRLPFGLTLNRSTGQISGTPTNVVAGSIITFQVTDSSNPPQTATSVLFMSIFSPAQDP
jgi:hypothetical protein